MRKIEFISYEGKYPNYCSGRLTLRVDGNVYVTEHAICPSISFFSIRPEDVYFPEKYPTSEDFWNIEISAIAVDKYIFIGTNDEMYFYKDEIEYIRSIVNENITQHRCCGGCS